MTIALNIIDQDVLDVALNITASLTADDVQRHRSEPPAQPGWFDPLLMPPGQRRFSGAASAAYGEVLAPTLMAETTAGAYAALSALRQLPYPPADEVHAFRADIDAPDSPGPHHRPLHTRLSMLFDGITQDLAAWASPTYSYEAGARLSLHTRRVAEHLPGALARRLAYIAAPAARQLFGLVQAHDSAHAAKFAQAYSAGAEALAVYLMKIHCDTTSAAKAELRLMRSGAAVGVFDVVLFLESQLYRLLLMYARDLPASTTCANVRATAAELLPRFRSEYWDRMPTPQKSGRCIIDTMESRKLRARALHLAQQFGQVSDRAAQPFMR